MRVAFIRTDISREYINDIENTSQRDASAEPPGQSRYLHQPLAAELTTMLNTVATLSIRGSDTAASVNTSSNNTLRIRVLAAAAYTVIAVTASGATTKVQIVADLNAAFKTNALPFIASVQGTNQLQIDTVAPNSGPTGRIEIDTSGNGSTLNTSCGITSGATTGLTVAALQAAVYPTATTVNVATATITALSTFTNMPTAPKAVLVQTVQDTIAPQLVETGPVLLSFVNGNLSKLRAATFQPGGARIGLAVGPAVAIVANDGSTVFTV